MYDQHFGLTGRPFQLTPDPAFWYETATHRRAMAYLGYGLAQGEGFIVITGDIGAGKTTLVGHLLDTLDREALNPVHLVSTAIEAADLLRIVAMQLGVDPAGLEKAQLLVAIERGLHAVARTGRRTLLIVDEAQALPTAALEELRMLSNFQASGHALLQIVLLGQPEFRAALHGAEGLEQLRQRVIAIHHLDPMGAGEVAAYVRHRLVVVGWSDRPAFAEDAFAALYRHSDGVPRRLNQLANRVMLHVAVEDLDVITGATVDTVAADLYADLPTLMPPGHAAVSLPDDVAGDAETQAELPLAREPIDRIEPVEAPVGEDVPATDEEASAQPEPHADLSVEPHDDMPVEAIEADPAETGNVAASIPVDASVRPFRHSWLTIAEPGFAADTEHESAINDDDEPQPEIMPVSPADRLAALEARIDEQDVALRRVLTLLVDWVENGETPKAEQPGPDGYVPIRGAAA